MQELESAPDEDNVSCNVFEYGSKHWKVLFKEMKLSEKMSSSSTSEGRHKGNKDERGNAEDIGLSR